MKIKKGLGLVIRTFGFGFGDDLTNEQVAVIQAASNAVQEAAAADRAASEAAAKAAIAAKAVKATQTAQTVTKTIPVTQSAFKKYLPYAAVAGIGLGLLIFLKKK
jgi:hypothetical protein